MAVSGGEVRPAPELRADGEGRPIERTSLGASLTLLVRVVLDVAALAAAVGLAFVLRFELGVLELHDATFDLAAHLAVSALWLAGVVGAMATYRLYDEDTLAPGSAELRRVRRALVEGIALVAIAVFLFQFFSVSRGWFALVAGLSLLFLSVERRAVGAAIGRMRERGYLRRPAILVSGSDAVLTDADASPDEFDVVARVRPDDLGPALSPQRDGAFRRMGAPVVVVDGTGIEHDDFWHLVLLAGQAGSSVFVRSPVREVAPDRLTTRNLAGHTIMKVAPPALNGFRAFEKRTFDLAVSSLLMLIFAVPMAFIAVAVLMTSGTPVFYSQQRVGREGKIFKMWKFRTMRTGAEAESGPVWAEKDDPRRTPAGRVLRRLSLDELPQLWNALRGDMSLVGPRPERPLFVTQFSGGNAWYRFRHRTRPGITGLAQVRGLRGDTPLEPRVQSDNWYIEHWSLTLDGRILLRTVAEVLRGRNAS